MALGWRGQYTRYREYFLNIMALYRNRADLKAFLEIILSLSTITIFLLFALKPTALTIISLYNQIQDKKKILASLDQKIRDLTTANDVFAQNQGNIADIDSSISNQASPHLAAQQIQGVASKNSVNVLGISAGEVTLVGTPAKKKGATELKPLPENAFEMPISISIRGSFTSLLTFIKDFENLRLVSKLDVLGISASETDTGRVIVAVISARFPFLGK